MDLLTRYYTDFEPSSLWIAEEKGTVVGYLTGCLNTAKFNHWMKWRGHVITIKRLLGGGIFNSELRRWARARWRTVREGGAHRSSWTKDYPAHFHMNLAQSTRGQGIGSQLLEKFIEQVRLKNVPGIHLATRYDNKQAQNFFHKHGFTDLATINAYKPGANGLEPVLVLIMGRKVF